MNITKLMKCNTHYYYIFLLFSLQERCFSYEVLNVSKDVSTNRILLLRSFAGQKIDLCYKGRNVLTSSYFQFKNVAALSCQIMPRKLILINYCKFSAQDYCRFIMADESWRNVERINVCQLFCLV